MKNSTEQNRHSICQSQKPQQPPMLDVVLSFTGQTFIDGQDVELDSHLKALCQGCQCDYKVRLFANSNCRFDHLTEVFRTCKQHGVSDVVLCG